MQKKKIGIITFAITLISIGILLLMRNFADINLKTILAIAWPSIIILFGLEIIVTKLIVSRNSEEIKTYIDPISVIMLSIIIVISSIYSSPSINKGFNFLSIVKSFDFEDFSVGIPNYKNSITYDYTYTIKADGRDKLQLINSFGDVEITEGSGDNIEVAAEIKIKHNDEAYADELSKTIVKIDEGGSTVRIYSDLDSSKYDKNRAGQINVNYVVRIPDNIRINIENKFGDTTVWNLKKDIEINNEHGNIEVTDVEGSLKLKNFFGDIKVINIIGAIDIENQHDNIYVENIKKDVSIKNQFGNVDAINIGGNLNIENEHADIDVEDIKGDLYIYSRFGNIKVDEANKFIKIISNNGDILFRTRELIEKGVEIENEFGNIDITVPSNQNGSFNVETEFGDISNRLGLSVTEEITEQSINDFIENTNIKFYLRSRNGNISINTN
ncbi:MAG: hypothetical protein WDA24_07475 [Tissierellales bacterium]